MFQNDPIYPNQLAFTSCKFVLLNFLIAMEHWTHSLDSGIIMDVIYLDITKAFTPSHMPDYFLNLSDIVLKVIFCNELLII